MPLPTFLIIGAAKSGTTSLYEYLNQHPEVFMSEIKEPKYFAWHPERPSARLWDRYPVQPHAVRDKDAYLALFSDAGVEGYAAFVPQRDPEVTASVLQELIEGAADSRRALREAALRVASEYGREIADRRFAGAMAEIAAR